MVQSHESNKFKVAPGTFYLKENEGKAFIQPAFSVDAVDPEAVTKILEQSFSLKEWEAVFEDLSGGVVPGWLQEYMATKEHAPMPATSSEPYLDLDSPRFSTEKLGVLHEVSGLSFDDESVPAEELDSTQINSWLKEFQRRFAKIKDKWGRAFADVEANHIIVVKDLEKLRASTVDLKTELGKPSTPTFFPAGTSVWSSLTGMAGTLSQQSSALLSMTDSVNLLQQNQREIHQSVHEVEEEHETLQRTVSGRLQLLEKCNQVFEQRFNKILPLLLSLKGGQATTSGPQNNEIDVLRAQVQHLSTTVESLQALLWDSNSKPMITTSGSVEASLIDIQGQLKNLQQRVVGGGCR